MELPADTTRPVAGRPPRTQAASPQRVQRHPTVAALQSTSASKWTTLLTFFLGDALGVLLLFAAVQMAAPWTIPAVTGQVYPFLVVLAPVLFAFLAISGFYRPRFVHPALEMKQIAFVTGTMGATAALTLYFATGSYNAALFVGAAGVAGTLILPLCRVCTRVFFARLSWWGLPTVVISAGSADRDILDTLSTWPEIGLRPVALLNAEGNPEDLQLTLGGPEWAPYLARTYDVPYAVLSMPDGSRAEQAKLLTRYSKFFDNVFVVSGGDTSAALWTTGQSGDGLQGYTVQNAASTPVAQALKRTIDLVGAALALVLLAPLFAAIALLIRLDSDGPVFFTQERIGKEGQIFTVFKFRSMYCNATERLAEVLENDPERRRRYEQYHKLKDDPRVTPVGKVLRRFSLDELPQLLNVLMGDMSLVGPRAYMPSELPEMKGLESVILQTPPGVTGLWQVSGRNDLSFTERVDLDVHYVQNWSPWLDLYLLVRTVPTVVTGEGAA